MPVASATANHRTAIERNTTQDRQDLELGAGAEPLDALLAALDRDEDEWTTLGALYGPGGTFDHLRKARLSVIALSIRDERIQRGEKVTDGLIDTLAHADRAYLAFLDGHTIRRARYLELAARREAIIMRINRGQAMIRYASARVAT